ncbi:four-carbon acid sugar kinase family protein [Microvirga roseola]|uniref:four-carbon acid sugar kinase family protein n=1 Tax=Microvirga roseola TaxID=2883126 RepID=UPI001E4A2254|nr:four-carbon acid sugar kinase family protein [Microvirga roseola]
MIDTLIIADDLSGAADCAAACVSTDIETVVILDPEAALGNAVTVAVDVDSRALAAPEAGAAAAEAVRQLHSQGTRILYQKMDSTLRGHWPLELVRIRQAAALALGYRPLAIVAPAFPGMGRVTIDGHVFANGMPLEGTELWKRAGLMGSADLRAILTDAGLKVGQAALEQVALGSEALRVRLAKFWEAGCDAVVCDAQTEEDLVTLAAASLALPDKPLWVGSAGLMRALAGAGERELVSPPISVRRATGKPILTVIGSASEISQAQSDALTREEGLTSILLAPSALIEGDPERMQSCVDALDQALASGSDAAVVVRGESLDFREGPQITAALAELIAPRLSSIGGLVVTGGETARAILVKAGISKLRMQGNIEPGVPAGLSIGTLAIPVITKAGAFGDCMTLVRCRAALRDGRDQSSAATNE